MERSPRSVEVLVDQQVQRWLLERSRVKREARPAPVIAVSRQYGARGAEIARQLADRLRFTLWDQEILHELARRTHVAERIIASFDESQRAAIMETMRSMVVDGPLSGSVYFAELTRLIHSIAVQGGSVLVGRGAQYMLDPSTVLRVRVVCPLDERRRGLAARNGITEAEAAEQIERIDADRAGFIRDHFGRKVEDPAAYDLVVNTATLSLERCVSLIASAYEARFAA